MEDMIGYVATYGIRVLGAVLLLALVWIVAGWISSLVSKALKNYKFDETLANFFSSAIRWLVLLLGVLATLSVFGVETTSFAAVIGSAGLAVGLAFQGSLSNLAAGVMLLIFRPFKAGDFISVSNASGTVRVIGLFSTTMDTLDNRRIILPNSSIFGSKIENLTHNPIRRVDVPVGVSYSADLDQTREVLLAAAKTVPQQVDEAPQIWLKGLGDSSVDWEVRVWCHPDNYWDVWDATVRATKQGLDNAGLSIPFPQMDVHLDGTLDR